MPHGWESFNKASWLKQYLFFFFLFLPKEEKGEKESKVKSESEEEDMPRSFQKKEKKNLSPYLSKTEWGHKSSYILKVQKIELSLQWSPDYKSDLSILIFITLLTSFLKN